MLGCFRYVLSYAYDTNDVILRISAGGSIDEQIADLFRLCPEFELVVRRLDSLQCIVEDLLNRLTERWHNESFNQRLIESLFLGKTSDLGGLEVPLIDVA